MEAVMIAGLAVVVVGGFYSLRDLLDDLGLGAKRAKKGKRDSGNSTLVGKGVLTAQGRVKEMAGMNV